MLLLLYLLRVGDGLGLGQRASQGARRGPVGLREGAGEGAGGTVVLVLVLLV